MRRSGTYSRASALCLAVSLFFGAPLAKAADVEVESETIVRYFERDTSAGEEQKVLPAYEYLRLSAGALQDEGFSLHAYGWGRHDLADNEFFADRSQGEILYGYLQYTREEANFSARLGRQYLFEGVANESVDGLSVRVDPTEMFSVSAYGGLPVALETDKGRDGDRVYGGRVAHHLRRLYQVGISYKRVDNDGEEQEKVLGVDSSLSVGTWAYLHGYSTRNLQEGKWQEHSYEARVPLAALVLSPYFQRFDYDAYFDTGANSSSPFRFLAGSEETVTILGGDAAWRATGELEFGARVKHFGYRERDEDAWYYAGSATWNLDSPGQVGAEVGRMDGDTDDTLYTQARAFFYVPMESRFVSGDLVYVRYDEEIYGQDRAAFAAASGGMRFLDDQLELSLSVDYSVDPYFDRDVRGLVNVKYLFQN